MTHDHNDTTTPDEPETNEEELQDEITRAREIIQSYTQEHGDDIMNETRAGVFGSMDALYTGHTRQAVRAALTGILRVGGEQQGSELTTRILQGAESSMPALHAYAAIRPHVLANDQAAGDYGAAKACLAAGYDEEDIERAICVHGRYGIRGAHYSLQIIVAANIGDAERPHRAPKAKADPGQDTPRPRAPW
ncbi:hypothetical protein [Fodinicurvata fenggangensis]|uniref:hypothetical protein n=1 Tax=Fodinicurvata fenggangensis TaxID=1121830 RepID=UPI00047E5A56|nr:hypothetical protein [Fodinicurvata fenggangensis]